MAHLLLIRHAQASLGKSNYDQLSELGHEQAQRLGDYLGSLSLTPNRIICGSLTRHMQTCEAINKSLKPNCDIEIDERWNEFDFKALLRAYISNKYEDPLKFSKDTDPKVFFKLLKEAMRSWANGTLINHNLESWEGFSDRILNGLTDISNKVDRNDVVLLTSSGGAIAMAMKHVLGLTTDKMIDINFQIKNTSFSSIEIKKDRNVLSGFNQTPHVDNVDGGRLLSFA